MFANDALTEPVLVAAASLLFTLAAWTRSLGCSRQTRFGWAGLGLLVAVWPVASIRSSESQAWTTLLLLLIVSGWALVAGGRLIRHSAEREELLVGGRQRRVGVAACAVPTLLLPLGAIGLNVQLWPGALVSFLGLAALCWSCLIVGGRHARRGDGWRALLARFIAAQIAGSLLAPFVLGGEWGLALGLFGLGSLPLTAPLALLAVLGPGPVPLDLQPTHLLEEPVPPFSRLAPAAFFGILATGALLWSVGVHLQSCSGTLESVPLPGNWRSFPTVAESDGQRLGPFVFHGSHFDYKGYPSAYAGAALGDPGLCFASTVALDSWFSDGDMSMYRSPSELRLHHAPGSPTFVVTATGNEEKAIAAFERRFKRQHAFDSAQNEGLAGLAALLVAGGGVALWSAWRSVRRHPERPTQVSRNGALVAYSLALVLLLVLERNWHDDATPRPGRELAVEHSWII